jgi:hypothetical protein
MYDLRVKAKTPGQPTVLVAANATATAVDKLVKRLKAVDLVEDVRIGMHEQGVTVDNQPRNPEHLEVLMAVLTAREAAAGTGSA